MIFSLSEITVPLNSTAFALDKNANTISKLIKYFFHFFSSSSLDFDLLQGLILRRLKIFHNLP